MRMVAQSVDVAEHLCVELHTVIIVSALGGLETCWDFHVQENQKNSFSFQTQGWFQSYKNKEIADAMKTDLTTEF